jgi:hypothetical protein
MQHDMLMRLKKTILLLHYTNESSSVLQRFASFKFNSPQIFMQLLEALSMHFYALIRSLLAALHLCCISIIDEKMLKSFILSMMIFQLFA